MNKAIKLLIVLAGIFMFIQTNSVQAQVINNEGAAISITSGIVLQGDTLENNSGILENNGTLGLRGNFYNFLGTTEGNGFYNLEGNWVNTGTFNAGISTVNFMGSNNQRITSAGGELFFNLNIKNRGAAGLNNRIILNSNVNIANTLTLDSGFVETGANTFYLVNQSPASLNYISTTGSRIIGKFERGVNTPVVSYLFPVGSQEHYNPLNLNINNITSNGSVLSEFIPTYPDTIGLPLADAGFPNPADSVEVYSPDSAGYWSLTAKNSFASNNYNINLSGSGFRTPYQDATRIIKRPAGGSWLIDGVHRNAVDSVIFRDNLSGGISDMGNHFGWGHIRPRIQSQPEDTAVCEGESAAFSVAATGCGPLYYRWEVLKNSGGWQTVYNDAIYSGATTDTLFISVTDLSMNGYKYRVLITDKFGNVKHSNAQATLTVNTRPVLIATPQQDTICNGSTTFIDLNSDVAGTHYWVEVLNSATTTILGADGTLTNDTTIQQTLNNPTPFADFVVYRIVPFGPGATNCEGTADTVIIWVEPTVVITALNDTICDNTETHILVQSNNITTNGIRYTWTVTDNPNITGESNSTGNGQNINTSIVQDLNNTSPVKQLVQYVITPWTVNASGNNECNDVAQKITIDIWVEPTVEIYAANDTICDSTFTNIVVSSTNITTNGIRYTWTATDNPNISGESSSTGQGHNISLPISQNLINLSNSKQLVQYTITPWTINASNNNECTDENEVITIDIWINPTPRVIATIIDDTICNDTRAEIILSSPSIFTDGVISFDYNSVADAGLSGQTTGITNRPNNFTIDDLLHNSTAWPATPQQVTYTIIPNAGNTGCADGPAITATVTVHPTPDTYFDMANTEDSATCNGDTDAYAQIIAQNGVNIFTYLWNDPANQTVSQATGLGEGLYTVTITDNQGCTKTESITIHEPNILYTPADSVKQVTCYNSRDGYASVAPIGGNGGYTYLWETGATTHFTANLDGGLFDVIVTDYKGCTKDTTIFIYEPTVYTPSISVDNIHCYGQNNGSATINSPAGVYQWDNGATTSTISNLSAGDYSVTITYAGACKTFGSITIHEPDSIEADFVTKDISCAGDADGTIDLTVTGGNDYDPYTFAWSTPDGTGLSPTQEDQSGLSGGNYIVTVTDVRGCVLVDTTQIGEPPLFYSDITFEDITCFGDQNGYISVEVFGGNGTDYSYTWSSSTGDTFADTSYIDHLDAGSYSVIIRDSLQCEINNTALINEPDLLETFVDKTDVSCFDYDDGSVILDITGGNGGYIINWSNGYSNDTITGLSDGTYEVTVTDSKNCVSTNYVEIYEPDAIENNLTFENITCFGFKNGEITVSPAGGTQPYSYLWSHDDQLNTSSAQNLDAGEYTISVVDGNLCLEESSIELTQPDPLIANIYKQDITCYGDGDGIIQISMTGGTPEYKYIWSDGNNEPNAQMLAEGIYDIRITDQHDCLVDTSIEIIEPEKLLIYPVIQQPTCPDIQNGFIELNINGGRTPYMVYWENGSFDENLYNIRSGIYDVVITDSSLCEIDTSFTIRSAHPFCFDIPTAFSPNNDGFNDKWVIDMKGLYPGAEIEVFDRTGSRVFYSKGYDESKYWDGTYNGKKLPMDAYYYIIYLRNGMKRISGTVTIVR